MSLPGKKPVPTKLLKLRGTYRRDRHGKALNVEPSMPNIPDWLDDVAKHKWFEMVELLSNMGVLHKCDGDALARYCHTWAWWRRTIDFLKEHGDSYPIMNESGGIKFLQQFPQVSIANKLAIILAKLEVEFGMTPSARSRLDVKENFLEDEFETWQKAK